jgi:nucleotide-binding universal stress UspA family protein
MRMFTKMLVPLDGSEVSEAVLPWVSTVARRLEIPVALLSMVDLGEPPLLHHVATPGLVRYEGRTPFFSFGADERHYVGVPAEAARRDLPNPPDKYQYDYADDNLKDRAVEEMFGMEKWLQERASLLESRGINVLEEKVLGAHDKPSQVILQFAREHGCDVIAMASHGRNLLEQLFKGSVTSGVIHSSEIPIIAISPEQPTESSALQSESLSRFSVLLDGSAFAESVLPYVKYLASRLSLEVVLIRWLNDGPIYPAQVGTGIDFLHDGMLELGIEREGSEETREASRYLQSIADEFIAEGVNARWQITGGIADSDRSELVRQCAGSIIVLASHGRTGIFRWLEGSVAEELLRESNCPLLIIPPALSQEDDMASSSW